MSLLDVYTGRSDVTVTIDFETYWDKKYTLKKMTTEAYVRDPRFEVIGVSVKFGSHLPMWLEEWEFRRWAARVDWSRVTLVAHHTQFDGLILAHHYGIHPRVLLCTMSMARAAFGPSRVGLEFLGPKLGVGEKGKEIEKTPGKHRADFTQREWLAYGDYSNNDVALTDRILWKLLPTFPLKELWLVSMTIRAFTRPMLVGDQAVLAKAHSDERERKAAILREVARRFGKHLPDTAGDAELLEASRRILSSRNQFADLLRAYGEEPPIKIGKKGKPTFAFAKTDPGMQALLEHSDERIRMLSESRLAVTSTIIETRAGRILEIAQRGAVPLYLKFCGAHTHRWSGGDKMNPQNFNRGGVLRDAILAPEGHDLAVADSGQIEARFVAWLAGQLELLDTFRKNDALGKKGDFYSDEGSRFFRKRLTKADVERQIAKALILGLGFGMGWLKCALELLKGMLGTPPVRFTREDAEKYGVSVEAFRRHPFGCDGKTCGDAVRGMISRLAYGDLLVHAAVTNYFVQLYRQTYPKIPKLWGAMNDVLRIMAADGKPDEVRMTFGPLKVIRHGIVKPSGLVLHYPGLRRRGNEYVYLGGKTGREVVKTYGGSLTENVVQSVARDCVAEQALWIDARYPVGTTTHDEVLAIPRESESAECLAYMLDRMKTPPAWCADIPLNASGGVGKRYGAVK